MSSGASKGEIQKITDWSPSLSGKSKSYINFWTNKPMIPESPECSSLGILYISIESYESEVLLERAIHATPFLMKTIK